MHVGAVGNSAYFHVVGYQIEEGPGHLSMVRCTEEFYLGVLLTYHPS